MNKERMIKKMPDQDTLEEYLRAIQGLSEVNVSFDLEKGEFVWLKERPPKEPPLGSAKTEFGEKLRRL